MLIVIGCPAGPTLDALQAKHPYSAFAGIVGIIAVALSWAAWLRVDRPEFSYPKVLLRNC
jgi:hypothetical protein